MAHPLCVLLSVVVPMVQLACAHRVCAMFTLRERAVPIISLQNVTEASEPLAFEYVEATNK